MLDKEAAQTLMSLSAPDENHTPLHSGHFPWHADKKRAVDAHGTNSPSPMMTPSMDSLLNNLPPHLSLGARDKASSSSSFGRSLPREIHERPLTYMIPPGAEVDSDMDMDSDQPLDDDIDPPSRKRPWTSERGGLDGLIAAAGAQASSPILIPSNRNSGCGSSVVGGSLPTSVEFGGRGLRGSFGRPPRKPTTRHTRSSSRGALEHSPTGVEEDEGWMEEDGSNGDYHHRNRLSSVCSSDGSEYGGLGRRHMDRFKRMEISSEADSQTGQSPPNAGLLSSSAPKYIGSYSPEARRRRLERFHEKRKRRIWTKKVDYDVRKNFANSRLRVKGRFVKKEDEELLCQLLSFT